MTRLFKSRADREAEALYKEQLARNKEARDRAAYLCLEWLANLDADEVSEVNVRRAVRHAGYASREIARMLDEEFPQ